MLLINICLNLYRYTKTKRGLITNLFTTFNLVSSYWDTYYFEFSSVTAPNKIEI